MTAIRLIVDPAAVDGDRATIRGAELRYLGRVRRARPGEIVEILDGTGRLLRGVMERIGRWEATIRDVRAAAEPPRASVTLALGLGRTEPLDRAVRAASELGADRIVALRTDRSLRRQAAAERSLVERWRRIALEGLRSSGNARPARIDGPFDPAEWFDNLDATAPGARARLLFDAGGEPVRAAIARLRPGADGWVLLLGPEGGLDEAETAAALSRRFTAVSLWRGNLRVETAVTAAVVVVRALADTLAEG